MTEKICYSKREAAHALGLSVRTIENLIRRKELVARKVGRRVLIHTAELQRFAKRDHATQSVMLEPAAVLDAVHAEPNR